MGRNPQHTKNNEPKQFNGSAVFTVPAMMDLEDCLGQTSSAQLRSEYLLLSEAWSQSQMWDLLASQLELELKWVSGQVWGTCGPTQPL